MSDTMLKSERMLPPLGRRIVTLLFCRVSNSAQLPVDALSEFQCRAKDVLQAHGAVFRVQPDHSICAWFGWHEMNEMDAENAVLAAFELLGIKAFHEVNASPNLRIGVVTGYSQCGLHLADDTPGAVSNRLLAEAYALDAKVSENSICVTQVTRDCVRELFKYNEERPLTVQGFAEPIKAFAVPRPSFDDNRFRALHPQKIRLLGRERELDTLQRLWRDAEKGCGKAVVISGEQGMGKSRLIYEFDRHLPGLPESRFRLFGSPHHRNSVLYPFSRLLSRLCGIRFCDNAESRIQKLQGFVEASGFLTEANFSRFCELLALPGSSKSSKDVNEWKVREDLFAAFVALIEYRSDDGASLIIFEDLHWADPTSKQLLDILARRLSQKRVMLLATTRLDDRIDWTGDHVSHMQLLPFKPSDTAAFVRQIMRSRSPSTRLANHIAARSAGVPLFIEELTKSLLEIGVPREFDGRLSLNLPALLPNLPISIQAALLARIERLQQGKYVAQVASIIGQRFTHCMLAHVCELSAEDLDLGLSLLTGAELIERCGTSPDAVYEFRHALVQEAAYLSVESTERKKIHLRIAEFLDRLAAPQAEPETLARHYELGSNYKSAALWWVKAGKKALSRSANLEAIEHLKNGRNMLRRLPRSLERDRKERRLLLALGPAIMAIHGYGSVEAQKVFDRAQSLTDEQTPPAECLQILCGLWNARVAMVDLPAAKGLAGQFLELTERSGHSSTLGHCMLGQTLAAMGDFETARRHLGYVIEYYRAGQTRDPKVHFAADEFILALSYMARVLWSLGFAEQAARASDEALERARSLGDSISTAIAFVARMFLATHGAPLECAGAHIEDATSHCAERAFTVFEHWTSFNKGALLVKQGRYREGIEVMKHSIAAADGRQTRQFRPFQLACIGEAYAKLGSLDEALSWVDEALLTAGRGGENQSTAGFHRIRGEILMARGCPLEAAGDFAASRAIARQQGARLEELRTAVSAGRYATGIAACRDACQALEKIFLTFTEGLDTPDLLAAQSELRRLKVLLDANLN